VERIYGERRYLGEERKLEKRRRVDQRVRTGRSSSEMTSGGGERVQKNGITREVYGEAVVWVG